MLGEQIGIALAQAEEVGAKGDVEASLKLMQKVEDLKAQKVVAEVRRQIVPEMSGVLADYRKIFALVCCGE